MATYVETAAARLDTLKPGWHGRIDVNRLDLNNYTNCILGQAFGVVRAEEVYYNEFRDTPVRTVFLNNRHRPGWREAIKARETELATAGD